MTALEEKIKGIIVEQLNVDPARVTPEKTIVGDLWADSLAVVELTAALEEAFHLEVPEEDIPSLQTVGDVYAFISRRVAADTEGTSS